MTQPLLADHELVLLGEFALESRRWSELERLGRRLCDEYPGNVRGPLFRVLAAEESGDLEAAEEVLAAAVERFPEAHEVTVGYAWSALKREDWPAAERRWLEVLRRDPRDPDAYLWAAYALRQQQCYEPAEALVAQAMVLFPAAAQPWIDYARIAQERGEWAEALRRFEVAREVFPQDEAIAHGCEAFRHPEKPHDRHLQSA